MRKVGISDETNKRIISIKQIYTSGVQTLISKSK